MRYMLIDGQGNFGSIDGDPPAAMRYTECRMAKISSEILADLDKETVDWQPNYDDKELEPTVMPTRVPNLLVNGAAGIAVGMATNIPPHNVGELIDGVLALIANPRLADEDLFRLVPGPDFPTGGTILGRVGILGAYKTGRGQIAVRGKAHFEEIRKDRQAIIVTEIPFMVNKARWIETTADLVRDKRLEGISDIRDESDRTGIRVVFELKRDANEQVVLNQLYKSTALQSSFSVTMLAIVDSRPVLLTLRRALQVFIDHRREVVTRRTLFDLREARARREIVEGLGLAVINIDRVIDIIRSSKDTDEAKGRLMAERMAGLDGFLERAGRPPAEVDAARAAGFVNLTGRQAQAILDMRLGRLTGLERDKIKAEYDELQRTIAWLVQVLADDTLLLGIIREELAAIRADYADARRTEILDDEGELSVEDLIADEDMVVTLTSDGYVKRTALSEYRAQRRGGRGSTGMATKEDDVVSALFVASAHMPILFFTSKGRAFCLKTYELPAGTRATRGKPVVNLLPVEKDEEIKAVLPVRSFDDPDAYVLLATRAGRVKKTELEAYSRIRSSGIIGLVLEDDDDLIDARLVRDDASLLLATRDGMAIHFRADYDREGNDGLRPMGRVARGVIGIRLRGEDAVVSLAVLDAEARRASLADLTVGAEDDDAELGEAEDPGLEGGAEAEGAERPAWLVLSVSESGFAKLTDPSAYRLQRRGGQGLIDLKTRDKGRPTKTGRLVGLRVVPSEGELLLVTDGGKLIRTRLDSIRVVGRNTMGVKVINLEAGERVVGFDVIAEAAAEVGEGEGLELGAPSGASDALAAAAGGGGPSAAATDESGDGGDAGPGEV
jgi:DNA gyrase subunit A